MLIGISPLLSPSLLHVLAAMGHTEEITLADANFPVLSNARKVVDARGVEMVPLLEAILSVFPLDTYAEHPVALMDRVQGDQVAVPIWARYEGVISRYDPRGSAAIEYLDKWDFYRRTTAASIAVVATGERSPYANVILRKGVVST